MTISPSGAPEDVDKAHRANAHHVDEAGASALLLSRSGFATKLADDLGHLANASGAEGMAHRDETARRADGTAAADIERPRFEFACRLARPAKAHRLNVEQLFGAEGVVQLHNIDVVWADAFDGPFVGGALNHSGRIVQSVRVESSLK